MGICQWFHFEDPRLDDAVNWLRRLGVRKLRTGLSWADWFRPGALEWFDRQMEALEEFDVTLTFRSEEHTSELQSLMRISYAVFCLKKKTKTQAEDTDAQQENTVVITYRSY